MTAYAAPDGLREPASSRIDWPIMAPDQDSWVIGNAHAAQRAVSVSQIDNACRIGAYVYVDLDEVDGLLAATLTRYQIWGAWLDGSAREREVGRGQCWVSVGPGQTKRVIAIRDAIITTDSFDRGTLEMEAPTAAPAAEKTKNKAGSKKKAVKVVKPAQPAQETVQDPEQNAAQDNGNVKVAEDRIGNDVQLRVPGTERVSNPVIEKMALDLYAAQEARMEAAKEEKALRDTLTKKMRELNIPEQILPGDLIVEIEQEPKAKVHKLKNRKGAAASDPGPEGMEAALEGDED
jgi:hypothetical protein